MSAHVVPQKIGSFPFYAMTFDKSGQPHSNLPTLPPDITDVVIASHGWNNDAGEAQALYDELFGNISMTAQNLTSFPHNKVAVIGVFWPSKKFNFANADQAKIPGAPGPAAAIGGPAPGSAKVAVALADLRNAFADESHKQQLVEDVAQLAAARNNEPVGTKLVNTLRKLLEEPDSNLLGTDAAVLFKSPTQPLALYEAAKQGIVLQGGGNGTGLQSPAAGVGGLLGNVDDAFENLLNVTSYYQMKNRAGKVGANGVAKLIDDLAALPATTRIHLVGHSFGGRLVAAAAKAATATGKLHSMTLLQAAFSHNGFSAGGAVGNVEVPEGYFRSVIAENRITGPILITYSRHDHAVGKAYAIASRLSNESAAGLGGGDDPYGGMGANGAQRLGATAVSDQVNALAARLTPYQWEMGKVHNLNSDQYISDHGAVRGEQVAWAIATAMAR